MQDRTYHTARTEGNHNNNIGLPMTILDMPDDTETAVLELGMNHFGEMARLTSIAKPDIAVITNIGTMHIEHLGSREGILQAKLEIVRDVPENGVVVVNGDALVPFTLSFDHTDFDKFLTKLDDCYRGVGIPNGFVPHSTFWLVRGGNEVVGVSNTSPRLDACAAARRGPHRLWHPARLSPPGPGYCHPA